MTTSTQDRGPAMMSDQDRQFLAMTGEQPIISDPDSSSSARVKNYLTAKEVSDILELHIDTVLGYLRSGDLKGFKPFGRRAGWKIWYGDLMDFMIAKGFHLGQ